MPATCLRPGGDLKTTAPEAACILMCCLAGAVLQASAPPGHLASCDHRRSCSLLTAAQEDVTAGVVIPASATGLQRPMSVCALTASCLDKVSAANSTQSRNTALTTSPCCGSATGRTAAYLAYSAQRVLTGSFSEIYAPHRLIQVASPAKVWDGLESQE